MARPMLTAALVATAACLAAAEMALSRTFQGCTLDFWSVRADSSIKHTSLPASTQLQCFSLTLVHTWAHLGCLFGGVCHLWGLEALKKGNAQPSLGGPCKMTAGLKMCQGDQAPYVGPLFAGETTFEKTCTNGYTYKCFEDGVIRLNDTVKSAVTACGERGSFMTSVGCLTVQSTVMMYSVARSSCLARGADLFYPDTEEDFHQLHSILENYDHLGDLWFGLRKVNGSWHWLDGRPLAYSEKAGFSGGDDELFGKGKVYFDYKTADETCSTRLASLCRNKGLE